MNILPLSLFCLCLCCGFSRGGQPPEGAPVRFRINMDQAAGNKAPSTGPVPDQSTPLNAAKLLLRALQEKTDWKHEPYKSLPATSPFVSQLRLKSILSRMEAVQGYVTGAAPERPPFVDEDSIIAEGDLAMAYILLPDKANPYVYAATAVALVKKEGQWKASLTPGSFDNTFLPFDDGIREKAKKISSEAKKKIFGLAHQYSVAAVKAALEHIKRFRQENVRGTTDDELKNLLIRAVKGDDPALIAAAEAACAACGVQSLTGKIATGDLFVGDSATKAAIEAKCAPDCVEMEGAAVSQIAAKNGVPCVILRAMSDNADEDGHEVLVVKKFSISEYVATATKIVAAMVESL